MTQRLTYDEVFIKEVLNGKMTIKYETEEGLPRSNFKNLGDGSQNFREQNRDEIKELLDMFK